MSKIAERLKASGMNGMNRSQVVEFLSLYEAQIEQATPPSITAKQIIQDAASVVEFNPKLKECTPKSVIGAVMLAAINGLRISPQLGECWFVPRKNKQGIWECHFQIGYQGWVSLGYQSERVKDIDAQAVYEGDFFDYQLGTNRYIKHKPCDNPGKLTHVYAILQLQTGGMVFKVLSVNQVESRRLRNSFQNEVPTQAWATDYAAMAMGKAIASLKAFIPKAKQIPFDEGVVNIDRFQKDQSGTLIPEFAENQEAVIVEETTNEG